MKTTTNRKQKTNFQHLPNMKISQFSYNFILNGKTLHFFRVRQGISLAWRDLPNLKIWIPQIKSNALKIANYKFLKNFRERKN